ncbi:hypothetical protein KF134_1807 [Lactococcus lactis subsp. lactis]|uniref:hypothetical protein n=1 Tax=Lactococcus lactis TaxID=1358 RepID=UPI00071DA77B|nr:hypothetical protein [Lactococcus lactis]KST91101.1 hypothetical protein KF134_1807 [Lactococcus lactis subsp. lactis]
MKSNQPKLYSTKVEISQLFGVKLKTLGTDLTKIRQSPEFSNHILADVYGDSVSMPADEVNHINKLKK